MLLIAQLALCFGGPTVAHAGQAELPQGYLLVYSATDQFDDGGTFYYPTAPTLSTWPTESSLRMSKITFHGATKFRSL